MKTTAVLEWVKKALRRIWEIVSRNLGWKIVSIVAALLLYSYIISADSSITQLKTLANVEVMTSGLTVLQSRDLALLTDVSQFDDIHVRVEASQANIIRVNNDTVHVELDLSQVTKAGVQEIELTGVTAYGKVVQVTPSSVEVVIESLASRYVPVNVEFAGEIDNGYWYNVSRVNPTQVTVSGPASIVRKVTAARAQVDVTDMVASRNRSITLALLDDQGNEVAASLARPSITEAMVNIEVYPRVQLSVDDSVATATVGTLPEGFRITGIDVQPEVITVAAEQSLLDELDAMSFAPIDVTGRTSSFSTVAALNTLKDIKYISSEQVTITIHIEEIETTVTIPGVPLRVHGATSGQTVTTAADMVEVRVTGPYTVVTALTADDIQAFVDVAGLSEGAHTVDIQAAVDGHGDVTLACEPTTTDVQITGGIRN